MKRVVLLVVVGLLIGACGSSGTHGAGSAPAAVKSPVDPPPPSPPDTVPTQPGNYNYSPSVMQDGSITKFWWCSSDPAHATDHVYYEEYNTSTKAWSHLQSVLQPGTLPTDWDTFGVCHPSVIKGSWPGAPGGGNFSYAMYYVSTNTSLGGGSGNSIGVVFSADGINWADQHAPFNPIINQRVPRVKGSYGAGLPAAWSEGGSAVTLFWTDTTAVGNGNRQTGNGFTSRVRFARSDDGIHFGTPNLVSQDGAPAFWKNDFAFDDTANPPVAYSAQAVQFRPAVPAPGKNETFNFGLYRIRKSDLLAGTGHWEQLGVIDTNLTGLPLNFEPGLVRTPAGGMAGNVASNGIPAYFGGGGQTPDTWNLRRVTLKDGSIPLLLHRYTYQPRSGSPTYWTTTGFVPPEYRKSPVALGYLDFNPGAGEVPLYDCQAGTLNVNADGTLSAAPADRFVSLDASCGGANVLGTNGYLFAQTPTGIKVQGLYACGSSPSRFVSTDGNCEGHGVGQLLGYSRTSPP